MSENKGKGQDIPQQDTALVETVGETFYAPLSIKQQFLQASNDFISSIVDDGTRATQAMIYNAMNNNDENISDVADDGGIIAVTNFIIYPVQVVADGGEILPAKRTVLIDVDGKTYGSVAEGVFNSMKSIVAMIGMPPWDEPVSVAPKRQKTRRGFYTLQLHMLAQ